MVTGVHVFCHPVHNRGPLAAHLSKFQTPHFTHHVSHTNRLPQAALTRRAGDPKPIPIVTGFLAKGQGTGAITTLGRGGSDLTATIIGAALDLPEVQVWKDVDGTLRWATGMQPHW